MAAVLMGPLASPSLGQTTGDPTCSGRLIQVGCGAARPGSTINPSAPRNDRSSWRAVVFPQGCYWLVWRTVPPGTPVVSLQQAREQARATGMPPCLARPSGNWEQLVGLPVPHPKAQPDNRALTGKRVFLELGMRNGSWRRDPDGVWRYSSPEVELRATPSYTIDWGDGTPVAQTSHEGVPYPGGPQEITHVYEKRGTHTVTVQAGWRAEWRVPGGAWRPVLGRLSTNGQQDFAIQQIQAVRTR
ncbi:MAG: PKD domain-containing protein [Egibacteraceae bacterium]